MEFEVCGLQYLCSHDLHSSYRILPDTYVMSGIYEIRYKPCIMRKVVAAEMRLFFFAYIRPEIFKLKEDKHQEKKIYVSLIVSSINDLLYDSSYRHSCIC